MVIFGYYVDLSIIIIASAILLTLIVLTVISVSKCDKNKKIQDPDTREVFGNFHGLLTKEDFEVKCDDPMLEIYREQWIKCEPGDKKDNYLLLYLALKQLNKEQDESENEWTQEECEARMDQIVIELSEKTGLKLIVEELDESEYDAYFNPDFEEEIDYNNESEEE